MEALSTKRAPPPLAAAFRSKKDAVRDALRDGIAQGVFKPGERLVIDDLAAQFSVSPIPVREALQQLQAEGFVEIQPHVGATVTRIEPALITEIFELLAALESISGRAACQNMSKDDFARMEVMLREMDRLQVDLDAWSAANVRLHQFICDCAGMPLVKSTLTKVLDHWDRLRQHYLNDVFAHRVRVAHRDHWQMFRAMRGCDVDHLERIVHEHNRAARDAYTEQFQRALERDSARG